MNNKMKVLISGGAGFIGSHLCDYFISQDADVVCVDSFITGHERNIKHLFNNHHFQLIKTDVSEPFEYNEKIDAVLHFASPASPKDFYRVPLQILKSGSYGTHRLLDLAYKNSAKFLLASTSEVYGDPLIHPQVEEYWGNVNPIGPRAVYDESKRFSEALTMTYHRYLKLDVKIARIFNTYGPRMRANDGRIVPNLICQALRNEPLTIYGNGQQTRSFCYITDMINGLIKLLDSSETGPINIGNPDEFNMLEFADLVIEFTKAHVSIKYEPLPVDDPKRRKPDINLARTKLNWQPEVKLRDGLTPTVEWFRTII